MGLIDLLPIAFFVILIIGIKPVKPILTGCNDDYISVKTTNILKGIFAITVLFHHITQKAKIPAGGGYANQHIY